MKKFILIFTATCLSLTINASAARGFNEMTSEDVKVRALMEQVDISKEIEHALTGVIDESVTDEVLGRIDVGCSDVDSNVVYTVKYLGSVGRDANSEGAVYTLTAASTKNTTGTASEDNVDCWITMTWIDNFGTSNQIVSVSGGWTPNGRTLSDRQVFFGVVNIKGGFLDGKMVDQYPGANSYNYSAPSNLVGLSLRAYSWVRSGGYDLSIYCGVWPTIFD